MGFLIFLGYFLLVLIGLVFLFVVALYLGALIPTNRKFKPAKDGIDIFISSTGMHLDFIVPTQNEWKDWSSILDGQPFEKPMSRYAYLGMGWGAPEFYLDIETWDKVPFKTAFRALAIPTPTIMHVIGYEARPYQDLKIKKVSIAPCQYRALCDFIYQSFSLDKKKQLQLIPDVGYTPNDNFYQAQGFYHIFYTCNYWVNKGLKKIGVLAPLWSPLDKGVWYQLDQLEAQTAAAAEGSFEVAIEATEVFQ